MQHQLRQRETQVPEGEREREREEEREREGEGDERGRKGGETGEAKNEMFNLINRFLYWKSRR